MRYKRQVRTRSNDLSPPLSIALFALLLSTIGCSQPSEPAGPGKEETLLDEAQRKYLWDVEHHVLTLKKHGIKELLSAIQANDQSELKELLDQSFTAQLPTPESQRELEGEWGLVSIQEAADESNSTADAFVAWLQATRGAFADEPTVSFSLRHLGPANRDCESDEWSGDMKLRISGDSAAGGKREWTATVNFTTARPTKERLQAGAWLKHVSIAAAAAATGPQLTMREVAAERGLDASKMHDNWNSDLLLGNTSGGVYVADFNRDGREDLLITDYNGNDLYQGEADGRFRNVTEAMGLGNSPGGGVAAVIADLDGDGWPDIVVEPRVYRNVNGERFEEVTKTTSLRIAIGSSGISAADFDRDGRLDLYVTRYGDPQGRGDMRHVGWDNDHTVTPNKNQLWRNLGDWKFEEVAVARNATGDDRSVFAANWLHANDDLWPDLYVANELGHGVLLLNREGTFTPHLLDPDGPGDHGSMGVASGDVTGDGATDIYVANMYSNAARRVFANVKPGTFEGKLEAKFQGSFGTGSRLYRNSGASSFTHSPAGPLEEIGWVYGPGLMDLDNNGWLDVYACSGFVSRDREKPDG